MAKTIAFIPLRKGSKGILNKNIRILGDKPLVCWVVDTLLCISQIDEIWVSTDCSTAYEILSSRYGNSIGLFHRNPDNAGDSSPVIDAILEFVNAKDIDADDNFVLVQATSPFTDRLDFIKAIECMNSGNFDSCLSCRRVKHFIWSEDGRPLSYTIKSKPMRQNYKGILLETGAFYASKVGLIKNSRQLLSGKIKVIETGVGTSIDIDDESDWKAAEHYILDYELK